MFKRTLGGMASEHLFYGVDWVVYCEGGGAADEGSTIDELFWTRVFEEHGVSVHCKSSGAKSNVMNIAEDIRQGSLPRTVAAMDRDYDDQLGDLVDHRQVFYTYGYSWESDVCIDFDFRSIAILFATIASPAILTAEYEEFLRSILVPLKRATALDYKYFNVDEKLFDRKKPASIIVCDPEVSPRLRMDVLVAGAARITSKNVNSMQWSAYRDICGIRSFYGKSTAQIIYRWFVFRFRKISNSRRVAYDQFVVNLAYGINFAKNTLNRNVYYADRIARIT
jgi:hypothetical protein